MEYTFKNSDREEAQTIILSDYSITIRTSNAERSIPYANVISVRLCKVTGTFYKAIIHHDGEKPLVITNQFASDESNADRSRMYATFIRVLHYHLKDKSGAAYSSGCNIAAMWKWGMFAVIFSFAFSFTGDYMGYNFLNPYVQTLILTCISFVIIFFAYGGQLPKEYTATDIPMKLLPDT